MSGITNSSQAASTKCHLDQINSNCSSSMIAEQRSSWYVHLLQALVIKLAIALHAECMRPQSLEMHCRIFSSTEVCLVDCGLYEMGSLAFMAFHKPPADVDLRLAHRQIKSRKRLCEILRRMSPMSVAHPNFWRSFYRYLVTGFPEVNMQMLALHMHSHPAHQKPSLRAVANMSTSMKDACA